MTSKKGHHHSSVLVISGGGVIGIIILLGAVYSGAFGTVSNLNNVPVGQEICDLPTTLSGTAHDFDNGLQYVDNFGLIANPTNCHQKGIAEFALVGQPATVAPGALLLPGKMTLFETLTDSQGHSWGTHNFDVNTGFIQVNKDFTESYTFAKLPHGTYHLSIRCSCQDNGNTEVLGKTITV